MHHILLKKRIKYSTLLGQVTVNTFMRMFHVKHCVLLQILAGNGILA